VITRSLRVRLLLAAGAATLVALVVAWLFMSLLFERHLERRMTQELTRDASRLVAAVVADPAGGIALNDPLSDPRLATPAGGFYWQVAVEGRTWRSRSLWDEVLPSPPPAPPTGDWELRRANGPFGQEVFLLERMIRPDASGPDVVVQLGLDAADVATAQAEFRRELALFLAALWLFLLAAAWIQVQLGLQPLAGIRSQLAELRSSSSARLVLPWLDEVKPLAEAINDLAEARDTDLTRARSRASDLAHGLKTPLAALNAQARRVRDAGQPEIADGLERAIAALIATTEAELARSRVAATGQDGRSGVRDTVDSLVSVLEQTDRGELVAFTNSVPEAVEAPLNADDLTELLGPLLENATRFAHRQVVVSARNAPERLSVLIEDDGPGIPPDLALDPAARGVRLDETAHGHGLGLSIAKALAEASDGRLALSPSSLGGLCVEVCWVRREG
jgi:signal transduction histidine kinase